MNNSGNSSQGVESEGLGFAQSQGRGVKTAGNSGPADKQTLQNDNDQRRQERRYS